LFQIFPDESLHSYLLRVVISHGLASSPADIKGIISAAGVLQADLALNDQQRRILSALPVTTLMGFLENRMPGGHSVRFSNPKSLAAKCGRIFFHNRTGVLEEFERSGSGNSKSIYRIHYCPKCIREQIQEYGSGWFKFSWISRGGKCDAHNSELVSIKKQLCSCGLNILDQVISALSGICVCCKSELKFPLKSTQSELMFHPILFPPEAFIGKKDTSVAVCFIRGFERWVRDFCDKSYYDLARIKNFNKPTLFALKKLNYKSGDDRPASFNDLFYLLDHLEKYANEHYLDFLDKHTELLELDCSDCVPAQIFVNFKVAKVRDCTTCNVKSGVCPLKT
jgi:hypothetical protein